MTATVKLAYMEEIVCTICAEETASFVPVFSLRLHDGGKI